tara:strand:+ start:1746 stop:2204 length:459 start_codon:yes stop_codon:yes gene_type:complete
MRKLKIYGISSLALFAASCSLFQKSLDHHADLKLHIKTSPCYGTCAVYDLTIENGVAKYYGIKHPKTKDSLEVVLPQFELDSIYLVFNQNNVWELDSSYDNPLLSDLPSVSIEYSEKDKMKKIYARDNIPQNLIKIINYIDRMRLRTFEELQ